MSDTLSVPVYKKFATAHCTETEFPDICAEILYLYLFKGSSVKEIERILFGAEEFHGFLSKTVLNYYGIDTGKDTHNRGIYKKYSPTEIIQHLLSSSDSSEIWVGKILTHKLRSRSD